MKPIITVSQRVIHALKVKEAIERMGPLWLLHPTNRVKRKPQQPEGTEMSKQQLAVNKSIPGIPYGQLGHVCEAQGYDNPNNIEHMAYLFAPVDDPDSAAYYCSGDQFRIVAK